MKIHYYGMLDSLESCYTFQEFEVNGVKMYIQNSPRFGYEPATMTIQNPALFIFDGSTYHRYVLEDYEVEVKDGNIHISEDEVLGIANEIGV